MTTRDSIPERYRHMPKALSSISASHRILVRPQTQGVVDPSVQDSVVWTFPNMSFLDCSSMYLTGEVIVDATDDKKNAFNVIQPSLCAGDFDTLNLIINRLYTTISGVILDDEVRSDKVQAIIRDLMWNSIKQLEFEPYQHAGVYNGDVVPTWKKFRIPLQMLNSQLFSGFGSDNILLPLYRMGKFELRIYFNKPEIVVSTTQIPGATVTGRTYNLRNLLLDCQFVDSKVLRSQMESTGWSLTFGSTLYQGISLPGGTSGAISMQLPSAFSQLSHAMILIQRTSEENDPYLRNRNSYASSQLSAMVRANMLVNSSRRYQEDLDQPALERERQFIHPESKQSEFFHTIETELNTTRNIPILTAGIDYTDSVSGLLSGIKTSAMVGSLVAQLEFTNPIANQSTAHVFLAHTTSLVVAPNGAAQISR